jgi:uncharacterized membrane protein
MKPVEFVSALQKEQIVESIRQAERLTSGEIRVFISRKVAETPVREAQAHFLSHQMHKTQDRNAVLVFVAPASQTFAVIGDTGVHEKCGDEFWLRLSEEMTGRFKDGDFTSGVVLAVRTAGELLAKHFPRRAGDKNELPDEVLGD